MKVVFFLASIAVALAVEFNVNIEEGRKFVEKVKVDVAAGTEEIIVPAHLDRTAVDRLYDFNVGYSARKIDALKVCHVSALGPGEEKPGQLKKSMELSKSKFNTARYTVVNEKILPLREMSKDEVGEKIAAHCAGYQLLLVGVYTNEDVDAIATSLARNAARSGKAKRTVVQNFVACRTDSTNVIETCQPVSRINARCKFRRTDGRSCIYKINCLQGQSGFNCGNTHIMSTLMCCDYYCG